MGEGRYIPDEIPGDFWKLIAAHQEDANRFVAELKGLSEDDLVRFCWNYEEAVGQIATLYSEMTSFSEDAIENVCRWVVSQGEEAYVKVWDEAEEVIVEGASPYGVKQRDPGLIGEARKQYQERFARDVPKKRDDRFAY